MSKKYDVVAAVGQYVDQSGQQKTKFENVGAVIQNSNGGFNLLLNKTFNPAGLAQPDKESVILSLFEPQQRAQQAMPAQQQAPGQQPQIDSYSDDVPF